MTATGFKKESLTYLKLQRLQKTTDDRLEMQNKKQNVFFFFMSAFKYIHLNWQ